MAIVNPTTRYVDHQEAQAIAEEVQNTLERRQASESAVVERERERESHINTQCHSI